MAPDACYRIFAGWMMDGRGNPPQKNCLLEIEGNRIRRLQTVDRRRQAGGIDLELRGGLLLPGLVDAHVHLFMSGTADPDVRAWQLKAPFTEMRRVIQTHCEQQLARGIAAVRDGGDYAGHTLRFKATLADRSRTPLTLHSAGRAWRRPGRYGKLIGRPPAEDQTLAQAIETSPEAVDHVKIVNSGLNSLKQFGRQSAPQFKGDELASAVRAAKAAQRKVMVHANGDQPVHFAVAAGCHSIEHGFFMGQDNLVRLAKAGTFWVPTAGTMQGYYRHAAPGSLESDVARRNLEHQLEQVRRARALGVRIAVGTDAGSIGVHHGSAMQAEIALLLSAGFSTPKVVQCAAANGAELMGLEGLGRIAPGCRATLLALPGGPQAFPQSLATPLWFMVDGRTVFDHRHRR